MEKYWDFLISYSRDIYFSFVSNLVENIQTFGLDIWVDRKDVFIGDNILNTLYNMLDNVSFSSGVIVVFDISYFQKEWCLLELNYILNNQINFFPILYQMEKSNIPNEYEKLKLYNMVTIRNQDDTQIALIKILNAYLGNNFKLRKKSSTIPKNNILDILLHDYWYYNKVDGIIFIKCDNLALFIKNWFDTRNILLDKHTKILINIIHYQLLSYYKTLKFSEIDIKLVKLATDELIEYLNFDSLDHL